MVFRQIPLYRFLMLCEEEKDMSKIIFDCGAGGNMPFLSLFADNAYLTTGIEFDEKQAETANRFGLARRQDLNIQVGDMRSLYFEDESFSFAYSYNSIFHMKKSDVEKSILELKRVLKPGGLMFVNLLSTDDYRCGSGIDFGDNQYGQKEADGTEVIHSYYHHTEGDKFFEDMELLVKETRVIQRIYDGRMIRQGYIDYIVRKK